VCEVERFGPGSDPPPRLLIEVPHGATGRRDYDALRRRLTSELPPDLQAFFFVNTDVGAPELAAATARHAAAATGEPVLVVRGLVPRTFADLNRVFDLGASQDLSVGLTPAVPSYVTDPRDIALLRELHASYQDVARRAYDLVCGAGGLALTLHTYAPRSVEIERVDATIVEQLRAAYRPERYASWPERPAVDVIGEASDGTPLAPAGVVRALRERFAAIGISVTENVTYRLHPATEGYRHAARHPGRVLCVEINRALLADPFVPFVPLEVGRENVERIAVPLACALTAS
jgi:hypothetical protein